MQLGLTAQNINGTDGLCEYYTKDFHTQVSRLLSFLQEATNDCATGLISMAWESVGAGGAVTVLHSQVLLHVKIWTQANYFCTTKISHMTKYVYTRATGICHVFVRINFKYLNINSINNSNHLIMDFLSTNYNV